MADEGKAKFTDLNPIRSKTLKASYSSKRYKIKLHGARPNYRSLIVVGAILCLLVLFINTSLYKVAKLAYSIRNERILIGFQNSAELRPTGGFWGSFGILQINKNYSGSTLLFETNPYKKDNQVFKKSTIPLPKPMAETWPDRNQSFVNANYQISFPETAKSLEWFLNEGWNEQTDGVVAISSLAVIDLLKLTGPVMVDGTDINAENFTRILSDKIDRDYWLEEENIKTNEPKTILKNMAPILIRKASKVSKFKLIRYLIDEAKKGYILAYFNDPKEQKIARELGLSGETQSANLDYLSINNANLNGGKSSLNVEQSVTYNVNKGEEKLMADLAIHRKCREGWPDILNRNYTRVVAPLGSRLIGAYLGNEDITGSINIEQENSKTVFGTWFSVAPGEDKTLHLFYELPFEKSQLTDYNLICQKQPGTLPDSLEINVDGKQIHQGIFDKTIENFRL